MKILENSVTAFTLGSSLGLMGAVTTSSRSRRGSLYLDLRTVPAYTIIGGVASGLMVHFVPPELKAPINIALGLFTILAGCVTYSMI